MRITERALRRIIREQIESAGEMPDPRAAKRGEGTKLVVYTEDPERAEFITVARVDEMGEEIPLSDARGDTYFYAESPNGTVDIILSELSEAGEWGSEEMYEEILETVHNLIRKQYSSDNSTFRVTMMITPEGELKVQGGIEGEEPETTFTSEVPLER